MRFKPVSLQELLNQFGGTLEHWVPAAQVGSSGVTVQQPDTPDAPLTGFQTLDKANAQHLAFFTNPKYKSALINTLAGVALVRQKDREAIVEALNASSRTAPLVLWWVADAYLSYAKIQQWWVALSRPAKPAGVHPTACVDPSARVHETAHIGAHAVIGASCEIGAHVVVSPGCVLGQQVTVGENTVLHAQVTVYDECQIGARCILHSGAVIGADGFGFAPEQGQWVKIPQVGRVLIGDDVEIGANTTIDRGALDDTLIGHGVKLDNQIMIAHNVTVGDHTAMAGCVGIAGSTHIGSRCTIGGAANIFGHLSIADGTHVSGCTTVISSIKEPGAYTGFFPMDTHKQWEKTAATLRQITELRARVRELEKALKSAQ